MTLVFITIVIVYSPELNESEFLHVVLVSRIAIGKTVGEICNLSGKCQSLPVEVFCQVLKSYFMLLIHKNCFFFNKLRCFYDTCIGVVWCFGTFSRSFNRESRLCFVCGILLTKRCFVIVLMIHCHRNKKCCFPVHGMNYKHSLSKAQHQLKRKDKTTVKQPSHSSRKKKGDRT